ncbi:MAG: TIGR01777 family oxidoreductase [Terriglobia bacterium]
MKILISGSTGFIGSALIPHLTKANNQVIRLVRSGPHKALDIESTISWNPGIDPPDLAKLEGVDAVIHLAGESIASGRWSSKRKSSILNSRSKGTQMLSTTLARLSRPPKVLVSASAVGYYGNRGEEQLTESSPPGEDFLATVCREWEKACMAALQAGIRVVNLRIGMVLSPSGGALQRLLLPFQLGAGGILGSGSQYMSWVALDDLLCIFHHVLLKDSLRGPVNAVSPNPVTNREFTKTLGRVLRRPTLFPVPAFAIKLALGEMAEALLLASQRVEPHRLLESGYSFRFPLLEATLRHQLGK